MTNDWPRNFTRGFWSHSVPRPYLRVPEEPPYTVRLSSLVSPSLFLYFLKDELPSEGWVLLGRLVSRFSVFLSLWLFPSIVLVMSLVLKWVCINWSISSRCDWNFIHRTPKSYSLDFLSIADFLTFFRIYYKILWPYFCFSHLCVFLVDIY